MFGQLSKSAFEDPEMVRFGFAFLAMFMFYHASAGADPPKELKKQAFVYPDGTIRFPSGSVKVNVTGGGMWTVTVHPDGTHIGGYGKGKWAFEVKNLEGTLEADGGVQQAFLKKDGLKFSQDFGPQGKNPCELVVKGEMPLPVEPNKLYKDYTVFQADGRLSFTEGHILVKEGRIVTVIFVASENATKITVAPPRGKKAAVVEGEELNGSWSVLKGKPLEFSKDKPFKTDGDGTITVTIYGEKPWMVIKGVTPSRLNGRSLLLSANEHIDFSGDGFNYKVGTYRSDSSPDGMIVRIVFQVEMPGDMECKFHKMIGPIHWHSVPSDATKPAKRGVVEKDAEGITPPKGVIWIERWFIYKK